MERKPYFTLYADDFFSGVARMSDAQCGVYIKLLCQAWSTGGLTYEEARCVSRDDEAIDAVLYAKFELGEDGRYRNQKLEKVRAFSEKQSQNRRGSEPNANQTRTKSQPKSNQNNNQNKTKMEPHIGIGIGNKEKKKGAAKFDPLTLDLPFDTDRFRAAWSDWCANRSEIGKAYKPTAARTALKRLEGMGHNRAVAALVHSTSNGWQGIFEPTGNNMEPSPEPKAKPKPITGDNARYDLMRIHGVSEARDWSDDKCIAELRHRRVKAPPEPQRNDPAEVPT